MDRMDVNAAFAARVNAERATMIANEVLPETWTEVCPGTNLKANDDVMVLDSVVRVLGPNPNDPTYFQCAWLDAATLAFTTGNNPAGDFFNQYITDRAPADPEDEDPIYIEPTP